MVLLLLMVVVIINGNTAATNFNPFTVNINTQRGQESGYATLNPLNFGQKPFKFPPPAGFQPLALANTPRPSIVRPDQYVGVTTYTGNGGTQSINVGFKPDLIWVKERTATGTWADHNLTDSVRGTGLALRSNTTDAETNVATAFSQGGIGNGVNNGFTIISGTGGGTNNVNANNSNYVAWCWKAGGNSNTFNIDDVGYATASAAGLTAGTITPTGASVGTKQGFSIIKYTGTGSAATLAHGLNAVPSMVIIKDKSGSGGYGWRVYHKSLTSQKVLYLNNQNSESTEANPPWAEIPGFSKFGSYVSNASSDGPYVRCGFKPAFLMIKLAVTENTRNWIIIDNQRDKFNACTKKLAANSSVVENDVGVTGDATQNLVDFVSDGFKLRTGNGDTNGLAGYTYIYAAFAETPTQNLYGAQSNAR
jgi:hypothetical protein